MKQIVLSFEISHEKLGYEDAANLRNELSQELDNALKHAGVGKWVGGTCDLNYIDIFIRTDNPDAAISVIESTFANNPLFPYRKIKQKS